MGDKTQVHYTQSLRDWLKRSDHRSPARVVTGDPEASSSLGALLASGSHLSYLWSIDVVVHRLLARTIKEIGTIFDSSTISVARNKKLWSSLSFIELQISLAPRVPRLFCTAAIFQYGCY